MILTATTGLSEPPGVSVDESAQVYTLTDTIKTIITTYDPITRLVPTLAREQPSEFGGGGVKKK